mmetsp:Transcript_17865/g.49993  ORF Transcript_17865/g.49993 Transcript_17865/m.49993 type:complete len:260 (-) Transcript_17865:113-892(-)
MNSVLRVVTASCSCPVLLPSIASTSSMKMMDGWIFQARVKIAVTSLEVSPNHLLWMELALMLMKRAPDSFAKALASMVLPVPGGPYRRMPLVGFRSCEPPRNRSGRCMGAITLFRMASTMELSPPMSSSVTLMLSGLMTSVANIDSYWFRFTFMPRARCISFIRFFPCLMLSRLGSSIFASSIVAAPAPSTLMPKARRSCHSGALLPCFFGVVMIRHTVVRKSGSPPVTVFTITARLSRADGPPPHEIEIQAWGQSCKE